MENLEIVTPPEIKPSGKHGGFWKQLGMLVLGTTVSLVLTFGTAQIIEKEQRAKDRRLTALMVMSNIEAFAQQLDSLWIMAAHADTATAWLLNIQKDSLDVMDQDDLLPILAKAKSINYINYDKTTENIFSNNIETWKNMGNVHFIDQVGSCFSALNGVEEQFNEWVREVVDAKHDVNINPDKYEGSTVAMKMMHSDRVRTILAAIHNRRCWLCYAADCLRFYNLGNMEAIGITEQEVMKYTDAREKEDDSPAAPPNAELYYTDPYTLDSLTSLRHLTARIEELKALN